MPDASHVDLDLTEDPFVPPRSSRVFPSSGVCVVALSLHVPLPCPSLVFPRVGRPRSSSPGPCFTPPATVFVPLSSVNLEFGASMSSSLASPSSTPIAVPSAPRRSMAPHSSPPVTPSGALGPPLPSVAGFVSPEGEAPARSGSVAHPWSTPQPFQRVRCSRASSSSSELVQTSGRRMTPESPPLDGLAPRQAGLPSVSAGVPSPPPLRPVWLGAEGGDPVPEWFGVPLERSTPLPLDRLRFPWCRYARFGITVAELLGRRSLRPDLLRVRKEHEAGRGEEASLLLARLLAEGGGAAY